MEQRTQTLSTKFHRYFINKLEPTLIEHRKTVDHIGYFDKSWTNNNSESLNHVLKRAIDWKSQPLLDLVQIIRDIVDTQYYQLPTLLPGCMEIVPPESTSVQPEAKPKAVQKYFQVVQFPYTRVIT